MNAEGGMRKNWVLVQIAFVRRSRGLSEWDLYRARHLGSLSHWNLYRIGFTMGFTIALIVHSLNPSLFAHLIYSLI